ncbi:molybdopterin-dependent oxidoreductase [Vreelandella profundi]|uniref:molybdopterin-dependent oxidoreductase n=1 Tax=Vreelandella profundi TaxID=2852117 RepID=UPI001EF00A0A|nr:molybdopterin-dependent oxidoreductase [Halomonas profundi]
MAVKASLMGWAILMLSMPLAGWADAPEARGLPSSAPVILTVSGNIAPENAGHEVQLDFATLEALPQYEFATNTPWTAGVNYYRGPLMRDLLSHLNADAESVHIAAMDGYEADIPVSDFEEHDVILALTKDGAAIPVRELGPLWILYPFDQDETLLSEKMRFRSVWQVLHINVR